MATKKNNLEWYAEMYFDELKDNGFLEKWEREVNTFFIYDNAKINKLDLKSFKKLRYKEVNLLQKLSYTADYTLTWSEKANLYFHETIVDGKLNYNAKFISCLFDGNIVSFVDIKPPAKASRFTGSLSSSATFPIIQKLIYDSLGVFINKIIPMPMSGSGVSTALFNNTFTPRRYLFTDGGSAIRKQNYKVFTIQDFIAKRTKEINYVNKLLNIKTLF